MQQEQRYSFRTGLWGRYLSPELENIRQKVERLTQGWAESDWRLAPAGKWTSGQILEHLRLTFTATTRAVRNVMEAGRPLGGKPSLGDRWRMFWVTKLGLNQSGRVAPRQIVPKESLGMDSMGHFYDALVALDTTLTDAERRFGGRVTLLDHPFLGPLTARQWRQFHRTHARHHLKQIARRKRQAHSGPADARSSP